MDPGRQPITVVRRETRVQQELPASTDAFVWLRLYQMEMDGEIPKGRREPLWWTLRMPVRPLTYHAHRMFEQAVARAGGTATLHPLRHTAAHRIAEDPALPLTDVQSVLGHALLSTTQIYLTPRKEVIRRILAHHADKTRQAARISSAVFVQANGLGSWFQVAIHSRTSFSKRDNAFLDAFEQLIGEEPEPALYLVDPRRPGRGEVGW